MGRLNCEVCWEPYEEGHIVKDKDGKDVYICHSCWVDWEEES